MIIKLQNGDKFKIESDEKREARRKFKEYSLLSISLKLKRNLNIASNFLKSGPNITNFGNAISALFGGYSPEDPDLHYGEAPGVGIKNFANLVRTARVAREFNDVLSKAPKTKEFIMPGLIGWAPKTKFKGYHASNENPFIPDFFKEGWALKTHNAVKGIYMANGKVPGYGFLTKRKYIHPVETTFEKPLIQLGEVKGRTKNGIRNLIERDALEQGADGIIFKGIADNLMQNLFIAKTLNPDTKIINKTPYKITTGNAVSITPEQWTAAQDAAIARGDIAEAQRLRDLHFIVKAPETKQRTPMFNASGESTFNEFKGGKTGLNWFSESKRYAENHGIPRAFYINEPNIYLGNVPAWIKGVPVNKRYIESLKKLGYLEEQITQKVQEINEAANSTASAAKSVGMGANNELVTRNNNTIKLADAVTYDNNGVRIPLGERDNFSMNDIRYGLLPFIGLGTAGTLYRK